MIDLIIGFGIGLAAGLLAGLLARRRMAARMMAANWRYELGRAFQAVPAGSLLVVETDRRLSIIERAEIRSKLEPVLAGRGCQLLVFGKGVRATVRPIGATE